ncbi:MULTISPECIES: iron-containing alcohol dehydrogenase [Alteromonas]|uniref:iron-containing alcohol dehydrogenase n=1 Tax=Alteromonas TaxID=226 RepID=UPI002357C5FA|nr:iron-containing alcohol dehydrogenase [Alteromonas australica]|tara:strand:+ start:318 stop:1466 length:1149 start_codon:yes stop_codon:yes gene_type:complete
MQIAYFKSAKKLITGNGAVSALKSELSRLEVKNPAVITDKGVSESGGLSLVTSQLTTEEYVIFDDIPPEPEVSVIELYAAELRGKNVDGIIAVGGGSAMDSAKVLAVSMSHTGSISALFGENNVNARDVPLIAIPTTAGTGSEVTNIAILTDPADQLKKGIVSEFLLPDVAIVAAEMTVSCPPTVTAASGIDALVHALEAYLSVNASPITDALALKAIAMIYPALPKAYLDGNDLAARESMATGSLLAGLAFGNAGVGAVHALAYPLGGRFHLSHGMSNAVMLPHVMKENAAVSQERFVDIAKAMKLSTQGHTDSEITEQVLHAIEKICRDVEIPASLSHFDIPEDAIPTMAIEASKVTRLLRNNPRQFTVDEIEDIYRHAF